MFEARNVKMSATSSSHGSQTFFEPVLQNSPTEHSKNDPAEFEHLIYTKKIM